MVFQWFESAAPTLSTVLQYTATGTATVSPIQVNSKSSIKVLYDKTFNMAPTADGAVTVGNGVFGDKVYISGRRLKKVRYQQNVNTVSDGDIYLFFLSDDNLVSYPQITFVQRCSFYD